MELMAIKMPAIAAHITPKMAKFLVVTKGSSLSMTLAVSLGGLCFGDSVVTCLLVCTACVLNFSQSALSLLNAFRSDSVRIAFGSDFKRRNSESLHGLLDCATADLSANESTGSISTKWLNMRRLEMRKEIFFDIHTQLN